MSSVETSVEAEPKKRGRPRKLAQETAVALQDPIAPPAMPESDTTALIAAITKASRDPAVDIGKMQFLLDTRRALLDEDAKQEWRDAMALVQAEITPVSKDLENPQTRSRYSSLAALDAAVRPAYTRHGFEITYDTEPWPEPQTILVVCYVERGRHSRRYQIPMPCDGKGPRGNDVMSKTHATGSAVSYGRRYLLCMALNLVTADDDGNRAGYRAPPVAPYRPPNDGPPAPPPPDIEDRARHTRQAIEAATTHARSGLMRALEGGVAETTAKQRAEQLKELRELMGKAKIAEATVCEVFSVEVLDDLAGAQIEQAIKKAKKNLGDQ